MNKFAYVGTYGPPNGTGKGIYVYKVEPSGISWSLVQTIETDSPSFLCLNSKKDRLYAVNELNTTPDENGKVSAFSIDGSTGQLTFLSSQSTSGVWPCHLCLDKTETHLFAANYGSGSVVVFKINEDGSVGDQTDLLQHRGSGPNVKRQEGAHAHMVTIQPKEDEKQHLQVVDLGIDKVFEYDFDDKTGKINPERLASWSANPGAGPRHNVLHGKYMYVINELASTIDVFPYALENYVQPIQTISTLPEDWSGESSTAEIAFYPSGKFLYGSNRGHDTIAAFSVNDANGKLTFVAHQSTKGRTPRHFTIYNELMYVGNQDSNNITMFNINPNNGELSDTDQVVDIPSPVCILIAEF